MRLKYYILIFILTGIVLGFLFAPDIQIMWYLTLAWMGMVIHFLKEIASNDSSNSSDKISKIEIYLNDHSLSTLITFIIVTVTTIAFFFELRDQLTLLSALGLGYVGDNAVNKWK